MLLVKIKSKKLHPTSDRSNRRYILIALTYKEAVYYFSFFVFWSEANFNN